MFLLWLAWQAEASGFRSKRYTLAFFWLVRYGGSPEGFAELDMLREAGK